MKNLLWGRAIISVIVISFALALAVSTAPAAVPTTINYQGYLTNSGGIAVNGNSTITFYICNSSTGVASNSSICPWNETQTVTVTNGIYNVILGSSNPINLPFDIQYYLGVWIGGEPTEMTPRQPLTNVAYSFRSGAADTVADGAVSTTAKFAGSLCADGQILKKSGTSWICSADNNSGGTITGINTTTGLTGGGTGGNVTMGVDFSAVASASSLALLVNKAGDSMTGPLSLTSTGTGTAGSFTVNNVAGTNPAFYAATNSLVGGLAGKFDGNVTVNGNVTATKLYGDGSALTGISNANTLNNQPGGYYVDIATTQTVTGAKIFSSLSNSFSGNGSGLTSLNPANISSGTASINISGNATNAASFTGNLAGDVSGTQSATMVGKVNGNAIPASKTIVGTNASGQIIDASAATLSNNTTGTATNVTGIVAVGNGGTGGTAFSAGYLKGNGASPFIVSATVPNTDITGLGTMSTQAANNVAITGGTISVPSLVSTGSISANAGLVSSGTMTVNNTGQLAFKDGGSNYVGFKAPATITNPVIMTLPTTTGTNGQYLKTDASGILSWGTDSGGTVTNIATGSGLTGGPITGSGTISIATNGINNSMLSAGTYTSITGVGTINTGTWNGSTIGVGYGGTGTTNGSITGTGVLTFTAAAGNNNVNLVPTGTGAVDVASHRITSVTDPTNNQDAATKIYADAKLTAANSYTDSQVAAEATARASAVSTLQTNINNEISARQAADTSLTLNLVNKTGDSMTGPLSISSSVTGTAGSFVISQTTNTSPAIFASSNGSGNVITAVTTSTGRAGDFEINNTNSSSAALYAYTNGYGAALLAQGGAGPALVAQAGSTDVAGNFLGIVSANASDFNPAIFGNNTKTSSGGPGIKGESTSGNGVVGLADGFGWGGQFTSTSGNGIYGQGTTYGGQFYGTTYGGYFTGTGSTGTGIFAQGGASGYAGDFSGKVRASDQIVSTLGAGTAPFAVSSTTMVSNLNAEMLNGQKLTDLDARYINTSGNDSITSSGTGTVFLVTASSTTSTSPAIFATSSGSGNVISASTTSTGSAGWFQIQNSSSSAPALVGWTNGSGNAVMSINTGTGRAGDFEITNLGSSKEAVYAATNGTGSGIYSTITNSLNTAAAIYASTANTSANGLAGYFNGPVITTSKLTANSFSGDGSNIANLNGSNIASGTVADTRLSSNVALLSSNQTFTGTNIFNNTITTNNGIISGGSVTISSGNLLLPATSTTGGIIKLAGLPFIHAYGGGTNFFAGTNAGNFTMTGGNNTAIGDGTLYNDTSGSLNTATGTLALSTNSTGANNTANGAASLLANTSGSDNVAFGYNALSGNTTANKNTAIGSGALSTQSYAALNFDTLNTAVGYKAMYLTQPNATFDGNQNTALGAYSLYANTTGANNTAGGYQALYNSIASYNTAFGASALSSNTTGNGNTATGYGALAYNITGTYNTAYGMSSMNMSTAGNNNTATGAQSLYFNTGSWNTAYGYQALYGVNGSSTGTENVAVGEEALNKNTTGGNNTGIGATALFSNNTGSNNTALGYESLYSIQTGTNNTAIGYYSGVGNISGYNNIYIGANVNPGSSTESNVTRIGNGQTDVYVAGTLHGDGSGLTGLKSSITTTYWNAGTSYVGTLCAPLTTPPVTPVMITGTAPGPGTIQVTARFNFVNSHTSGTAEGLQLRIATTNSDCAVDADTMQFQNGSGQATFSNEYSPMFVTRIFTVSAGPYTYYLNGKASVAGVFQATYPHMDAVYYPN